jgi:molybdopterin converting factor small subunit
MIQINIRLSAGLAQAIGQARLVLSLPAGATVHDAITQLVAQQPALGNKLNHALPFVAGQQVAQTAPLIAGQELALLLPAAGG